MVKRNYAHCPLKKRPLALYNEPATPQIPEQTQPEDLSVKRIKLECLPEPKNIVPSVNFSPEHSSAVSSTTSSPVPSQIIKSEPVNSLQDLSSPKPITHNLPQFVPSRPSYANGVPPARQIHHQFVPTVHPQHQYISSQQPLMMHSPPSSVPGIPQITPALAALVQRPEYNPRLAPSPPQASTVRPTDAGNMPTLAEYYLQLFKATSEAEKKPEPRPMPHMPWNTSYLPPSPQASPVTPDQLSSSSPTSPTEAHLMSPQSYNQYPESSALISPVSTCSSTGSDDEGEINTTPSNKPTNGRRESRYSCDDCGKSYSTYSGLTKHKQFHCSALGARSFDCKHCDKTYTSLGALKMHIRTHTLPCKCHLCGKAFSRPWLLQGHIRTHTGEKPFQCSECERCFADRSNLRAHLQTHAHVKKYACDNCHKTFSRMSLLTKHMEAACPVARHNNDADCHNDENVKIESSGTQESSNSDDSEH